MYGYAGRLRGRVTREGATVQWHLTDHTQALQEADPQPLPVAISVHCEDFQV